MIHIDEAGDHAPRWRVFCAPTGHPAGGEPCLPPRLPSAVSYSDLRLAGAPQALPMLQAMHEGAPWSNAALSFPSSRLEWQMAGAYAPIVLPR